MTPVVVLTTVGETFDPVPLARELVGRRLAACVNIVEGVRSIYRWESAVQDDREKLLVIKTVAERIEALREALFAGHPYDVPEFVVLPIERIEGSYREWLIGSVTL